MVHAVLRGRPSASACASRVRNPASIRACPSCRILADCRAFISERTPGLVMVGAAMLLASAERSVVMEDPSVVGPHWCTLATTCIVTGHRAACAASITPVGAWFLLLGRLVECGRGPSSNGSDLSKRKFRLVYRSEDIEGSLPALIPT